jgi:hypothetical protein
LFPVLMIAGYANLPEDFERGAADFEKFLGRIVMRGQRGFSSQAVEKPAPAPEPPPVPPSAPDAAPGQSVESEALPDGGAP